MSGCMDIPANIDYSCDIRLIETAHSVNIRVPEYVDIEIKDYILG